jgi:hypothetical protein
MLFLNMVCLTVALAITVSSRAVFHGRSRGSSKVSLQPAVPYQSLSCGQPTHGQPPGPLMKCGPFQCPLCFSPNGKCQTMGRAGQGHGRSGQVRAGQGQGRSGAGKVRGRAGQGQGRSGQVRAGQGQGRSGAGQVRGMGRGIVIFKT